MTGRIVCPHCNTQTDFVTTTEPEMGKCPYCTSILQLGGCVVGVSNTPAGTKFKTIQEIWDEKHKMNGENDGTQK